VGLNFVDLKSGCVGDVQARRLKTESRGCLGALTSSLGEVRPLPYLSQTHVVLL
jgi:hypothetical protein